MISWIGARTAFILVLALLAAPLYAFVLVIALVDGHASVAYYEAVSQIIPVLILALAIELRYFSPNRRLPEPIKARFRHPERVQPLAAAYAIATLLALLASEVASLLVVASEDSSRLALSVTAAGLAAGGAALVAAILLPTAEAMTDGSDGSTHSVEATPWRPSKTTAAEDDLFSTRGALERLVGPVAQANRTLRSR